MDVAPLISLGDIKDIIKDLWDYAKPIVFVTEYEKAVVFRCGKYIKTWESGNWYFRIPGFDDYHKENVKLDTMNIGEVNITTLDDKTATIGGEFDMQIVDIKKACVDTNDWRTNIVDMSRGIMSNELEDINWAEIRKKTTKNAIEKKIAKRAAEIGIEVSNFNFTDKSLSRVFKFFNSTNTLKEKVDG